MTSSLLDKLEGPELLKSFSFEELRLLAKEVRERIISVMAKNGGHLSSNLGTVDLTIALHTVFSSPHDKFIFDVSHQCYTHKLLTSRKGASFDLIRKPKGLSGFCHPRESDHDHFFAGHAGTALSLSLGMAKARDLTKGHEHVLAVIGDATLTCGLSLEALNNIPKDLKRFIIILNDNAMSISKNVGGITKILNRFFSKSSASFFEHFGLSYVGPVDGHDIKKMVSLFHSLKEIPLPILVHLTTKKGYGLDKAEKDPIAYHGVKPFHRETCEFIPSPSKNPTFPKVFGAHLLQMGEEHPDLVVVTPAMSLGSCLDPFMEKFPERSFDVGIAEGHAVTFSGGLAKTGKLKVICSIYATFFQRALDNLFQDVCLQEIPVVFAVDRGGLAPSDGATHHGIYDISFLRTMPNMVICQPRDGDTLKELFDSAFSWKRPTAIRYPNLETVESGRTLRYRPLGKAEILEEGEDLVLFASGHLCAHAKQIHTKLAQLGIYATLVDPIFIKPFDTNLLGKLLLSHQKIVTIEEHSLKGGLASVVNEFILTHGFSSVQTLNFGVPEAFFDHGNLKDLYESMGMSEESIVKKILAYFNFMPILKTL